MDSASYFDYTQHTCGMTIRSQKFRKLDNKKIPKIKGIPTSWHWGTQPLAVGNYLSFRDKIWAFSKIKKGYATWCTTLLFRFLYISSNVLLISCICGVNAESLPLTSVVTSFWQ